MELITVWHNLSSPAFSEFIKDANSNPKCLVSRWSQVRVLLWTSVQVAQLVEQRFKCILFKNMKEQTDNEAGFEIEIEELKDRVSGIELPEENESTRVLGILNKVNKLLSEI